VWLWGNLQTYILQMQKRLYSRFSISNLIVSLGLRLCVIVAIFFIFPHYHENPIVISIVLAFCGLLILLIGNDEIVIYEDRLVKTSVSFWSMIFRNSKETILFAEIKNAFVKIPPKSTVSETIAAVAISALLKTRPMNRYKFNTIYFTKTDDSQIELLTDLNKSDIAEIVEIINSVLQQNIKR
jgi:hypothetical protein